MSTSATLGILHHNQSQAWSRVFACALCTLKRKQAFGYVESDEIRNVTPIRQNCNQTQWKGLNIKSDMVVNEDVFNRRLVTQLPKVALDYGVRC